MNTERAAELLVDLLNTRPYAGQDDRLEDPALRELRDALVALVGSGGSWESVNRLMEALEFRPEVTDGGTTWKQTRGDDRLGAVVLAVNELVGRGTWSRLRLCARPECAGAFYDTTRSATRRWHSYETCGNRTNVEAHRARKAH